MIPTHQPPYSSSHPESAPQALCRLYTFAQAFEAEFDIEMTELARSIGPSRRLVICSCHVARQTCDVYVFGCVEVVGWEIHCTHTGHIHTLKHSSQAKRPANHHEPSKRISFKDHPFPKNCSSSSAPSEATTPASRLLTSPPCLSPWRTWR